MHHDADPSSQHGSCSEPLWTLGMIAAPTWGQACSEWLLLSGSLPAMSIPTDNLGLEHDHYYRLHKTLWSVPPTWHRAKQMPPVDAHLDVHLNAHLDGEEFGPRLSCHHFTPTDGGTGTVGKEGMPQRLWYKNVPGVMLLWSSGASLLHLGSRIHDYSATGDPERPYTALR